MHTDTASPGAQTVSLKSVAGASSTAPKTQALTGAHVPCSHQRHPPGWCLHTTQWHMKNEQADHSRHQDYSPPLLHTIHLWMRYTHAQLSASPQYAHRLLAVECGAKIAVLAHAIGPRRGRCVERMRGRCSGVRAGGGGGVHDDMDATQRQRCIHSRPPPPPS